MVDVIKDWINENRAKFIYLHIMCNVILSWKKIVNVINIDYMKMVDDPKTFNNHAWDNVACKFFMERVQTWKTNAKIKSTLKSKFSLSGFIITLYLGVWVYFDIPDYEPQDFMRWCL